MRKSSEAGSCLSSSIISIFPKRSFYYQSTGVCSWMACIPSRSISVCAADLFSLAKALFFRRRSPSEFLPKQGRSFYPELLCRLSSAPRRRLPLDPSDRVSILSIFANIPQRHPQWFRVESFPNAVEIPSGFFLNIMQIIKSGSLFLADVFSPAVSMDWR